LAVLPKLKKEMALTLQQYNEILTAALDYKLMKLKGGIVFDEFDPAVEGDKLLRARLKNYLKKKEVNQLEKMVQNLLNQESLKRDLNFISHLYEKTGYIVEPSPPVNKSVSNKRQVSVQISGKGLNTLTCVVIELPTGSGSIYSIKGNHSELHAGWLDADTIEIKIPSFREEIDRVSQIGIFEEKIKIVYKEIL
jgi:hypothetical protein